MEGIVRLLDENIEYEEYEIRGDAIYIRVKTKRGEGVCPKCGEKTGKTHSRYSRKYQDLPVSGKKVYIEMENRKLFCRNRNCEKKTFAETFEFARAKSRKTRRLEEEIVNVSMNCSSVAAARTLSRSTVQIGRKTVMNVIKKSGSRR